MGKDFCEYNFKIIDYGNGKIQIRSYLEAIKYDYSRKQKKSQNKSKNSSNQKRKREKAKRDSMRWTRQKIHEIMMCNRFKYFITVTFDSAKYGSSSYAEAYRVISQYLYNLKKKCSNMYYICVAGQASQNGRWHFHICISNIEEIKEEFELAINQNIDSPFYGKVLKSKQGRKVYNIKSLNKIGYNTLVKIWGQATRLANYLIKNIVNSIEIKGRKRYSTGGKIKKPQIEKKLINSQNPYEELKKYGYVYQCKVHRFVHKEFKQFYTYLEVDTTKKYDDNFKIQYLDEFISKTKIKKKNRKIEELYREYKNDFPKISIVAQLKIINQIYKHKISQQKKAYNNLSKKRRKKFFSIKKVKKIPK